MKVNVKKISPMNKEAKKLFKLLDAHNVSHCPPEECHLTQPEELEQANSILLGIFSGGALCGMGGLKFIDDYAEVSRMFILEEYRGNGLAVRLLNELEKEAVNRGRAVLRLETSDKFKKAFRLYLKYGFNQCEPFGEYINATYKHTYMEKKINIKVLAE
jgi:putative acetyltransferase